MLSVVMLASKKLTIMHYMTALNASKKRMTPTIGLKFFVWAVIVTLQSAQNHCAGVAMFLAEGDKVGYFLNRSHITINSSLVLQYNA